jgi:hypothetical protein
MISAGRDLEAVLRHISFKYLRMEGEKMRNILKKKSVSHYRTNLLVEADRYPLILKYYQSGQWTDMSCRNLELKVDFLVAQCTSHLLY